MSKTSKSKDLNQHGQGGKGVPVILTEDVKDALAYLSNREIREKAGLSSSKYLFANSSAGVFRAYDCIKKLAEDAELQMPQLVRTSNMRKYMATMFQSLNTNSSERQWVMDHLGHTMDVHRVHYRQTSHFLEKVEVAKVLLIQDFGLISNFVGKRLDEIQLEDIVPSQEETEVVLDEMRDEVIIPDIEDFQVFEQETSLVSPTAVKVKRKTPNHARQKWTAEEETELKELFKDNFSEKRCPRQKEIENNIKKSRSRGGVIYKRPRDNIKKKMSNMLTKLRQG